MLAAQRQIYTHVKLLLLVSFVFAVIIPVIFSSINLALKLFSNSTNIAFTATILIYGVTVLIINQKMMSHIGTCKKKAATIQEKYDSYVLGVPWNEILVRSEPTCEDIEKYSDTYLKKHGNESLKNWYLNTPLSLPLPIQVLLCQSKNLGWDSRLKKITTQLLSVIIAASAILLLIIGSLSNSSLVNFLASVTVSLPIYNFYYKYATENKSVISKMDDLKRDIEIIIEKIKTEQKYEKSHIERIIRAIQDNIYAYRAAGNPAPSIIHKLSRSRDEEYYNRIFEKYNTTLNAVSEVNT